MGTINVRKMGLSAGLTGVLFYLGCMILMFAVGREGSVKFFNSLLHGFDVSTIIRMEIPLWESGLGIVQTFILAGLVGACIALLYNWQIKNR
tara:strand:+ start:1916 stop:2191 length:276 start_codon:yes stop_codon:yes gene_type:complete